MVFFSDHLVVNGRLELSLMTCCLLVLVIAAQQRRGFASQRLGFPVVQRPPTWPTKAPMQSNQNIQPCISDVLVSSQLSFRIHMFGNRSPSMPWGLLHPSRSWATSSPWGCGARDLTSLCTFDWRKMCGCEQGAFLGWAPSTTRSSKKRGSSARSSSLVGPTWPTTNANSPDSAHWMLSKSPGRGIRNQVCIHLVGNWGLPALFQAAESTRSSPGCDDILGRRRAVRRTGGAAAFDERVPASVQQGESVAARRTRTVREEGIPPSSYRLHSLRTEWCVHALPWGKHGAPDAGPPGIRRAPKVHHPEQASDAPIFPWRLSSRARIPSDHQGTPPRIARPARVEERQGRQGRHCFPSSRVHVQRNKREFGAVSFFHRFRSYTCEERPQCGEQKHFNAESDTIDGSIFCCFFCVGFILEVTEWIIYMLRMRLIWFFVVLVYSGA